MAMGQKEKPTGTNRVLLYLFFYQTIFFWYFVFAHSLFRKEETGFGWFGLMFFW